MAERTGVGPVAMRRRVGKARRPRAEEQRQQCDGQGSMDAAGHALLDVRAQRAEDGGERAGVEEEHRGAHQVRPSSSPEVRNTQGKYARSDCPFAASALM